MKNLQVTTMTNEDRDIFLEFIMAEEWQFTQAGHVFTLPEKFDDGPWADGETCESVMREYLETMGIRAGVKTIEIPANPDAVFVDVATKLLDAIKTSGTDPVAFLKAELDARKGVKTGRDYMEQVKHARELSASIIAKVERFAIIHQNTGTWYDDLSSVIGRLKEIDNFIN